MFRLLIIVLLLASGWRYPARLLLGLGRLFGLIRLGLCVFRMFRSLRIGLGLLVTGWRRRRFVAGLFAGSFFWLLLIFIGGEIFGARRFAHYILHWALCDRLSRGAFDGIHAGAFVRVDRSFLSVNIHRFAFEISDRPRVIDDRNVVYNQVPWAEAGAEAVYSHEHKK